MAITTSIHTLSSATIPAGTLCRVEITKKNKKEKLILYFFLVSEGVTLTVSTFHPRPWQQQQQRLVSYIISAFAAVQTMTPYGSVKDIIVSSSSLYMCRSSLLFEMRRGSRSIARPSTAGQHTQRVHPSLDLRRAECPISNAFFFVFF